MKLKRFKERDHKRTGIMIFTIVCILLVSSVILYRTFAIFEVKTNQNVIKGTVQDPGNIYFAFYVDNNIQKEMPQKGSGYILDEEASYCGVTGENDHDIKISLTEDYTVQVSGMTSSRTKCNLYFVSGAFILGKPINAVTSGDGLYEVTHEDINGTINDTGFKETEFRYAGNNPNNYVTFNDEKWRIIGLVNVMTSDNTVEQRVKITRSESIGKLPWDSNNSSDWTKASLQELLNSGNYYTRTDSYSQTGLTESAKPMIEKVTWNIGGIHGYSSLANGLVIHIYNMERTNTVKQGNPHLWNGEVALIYPSDYGYATSGGENKTRNDCMKQDIYHWINQGFEECYRKNWLYHQDITPWTLSHVIGGAVSQAIRIFTDGGIKASSNITQAQDVFPTLYLKTNVKIKNDGNDGSDLRPYQLTLLEA